MRVVHIRGLVFSGCHGCTAKEKGTERRFLVGIRIEAAVPSVLSTDRPSDTADWDPMRDIARQVITGEPKNTVEWLAAEVARRILLSSRRVVRATVTVEKPEEWEDRNGIPGATVTIRCSWYRRVGLWIATLRTGRC